MVERPLLSPQNVSESPLTIWVVFSDDTDIRMLKILRKGFRHCFIMMQQDQRWILIDPRADKTDIRVLPHPVHFNFPRYFTQQGKIVVKAPTFITPRKIAPLSPFSCVETVKRVLGVHKRFLITPYRLYRYLLKSQSKG
tara:strand:+ start:550 stop:966 length:417 start_codon:yes stop_codon:yes gene_type:complete